MLAIEVDGGMKPNNCADFVDVGADAIVIGTGIYKSDDYNEAVRRAKQNMLKNDFEARKRLEAFLLEPSKSLIDNIERRKRLDQLRINMDIPLSSWDPVNSKR